MSLVRDPDPSAPPDGDQFKQILDAVPIAIAVAELLPSERIVYVNEEFERLTGRPQAELVGQGWEAVPGNLDGGALGVLVSEERDYLGAFTLPYADGSLQVDAWSSLIEDGEKAVYRILALAELTQPRTSVFEKLEDSVRAKDAQLRELQHRVKNNLQMITALIRAEARGVVDAKTGESFERLAGRIEALGVLYRALSESESEGSVDLGTYLTEVATAVMAANAMEGVRLNLQVDSWPIPIDIAMPLGLVVNELITNSLKHAFQGREPGTISLHCAAGPEGCRVEVADDGVGLPADVSWPGPGKLSSIIVRALLLNARARSEVASSPGEGTRVVFAFDAVPAEASPQA
ncbi:MAG TPA: histidine kinase dimerization/phosphoacceptor domain -containing protein [Caulobacteraceae bacterium]